MNPAAVALKELLAALKEGEFYDEHNHETCYLVTKSSVVLAKAKAVALFDLDAEAGTIPTALFVSPEVGSDEIADLFRMLD